MIDTSSSRRPDPELPGGQADEPSAAVLVSSDAEPDSALLGVASPDGPASPLRPGRPDDDDDLPAVLLLAFEVANPADPKDRLAMGRKARRISEQLGLKPVRYYQRLNEALDDPAVLAAFPVEVNRLRRLRQARRDERERARADRRALARSFR